MAPNKVKYLFLLLFIAAWPGLCKAGPGDLLLVGVGSAAGCAQATTFIARTSGENTVALTTFICGLVSDGIITGNLTTTGCGTLLDRLFIHAMANSTDSLLDVCGNASATLAGSPNFHVNGGYSGAGVSTAVDTGYNPSGTSQNALVNSMTIFAWSLSTFTSDPNPMIIKTATNSTTLYNVYTDGNAYCRVNDNNTDAGAAPSATNGMFACVRSSSTLTTSYRNATSFNTTSTASTGFPGSDLNTGANGFINGMTGFGVALSGAQLTSVYNRGCTYMTAVFGSC